MTRKDKTGLTDISGNRAETATSIEIFGNVTKNKEKSMFVMDTIATHCDNYIMKLTKIIN